MDPTSEQQAALDLFATGDSLAIEAGAGTGKTSTLELVARSTQTSGAYVAFNKAIVQEAERRMPMNVASRTAHSLAFGQVGKAFAHRLRQPRMKSHELADVLGIFSSIMVTYDGKQKALRPGYLASHVMRAVQLFCNSDDDRPTRKHFPYIDGIDPPKDGRRSYENNRALAAELEHALAVAWADLTRPEGRLPFRHDHYLKLWERSDPRIPGEFVMFDEAQDASPVMLSAVRQQADAQVVFVGDSQQAIYEWRGAVNALGNVDADHRRFLTQSFRFGDAIAEVANVILDRLDADLRLVGTPSIGSSVAAIDGLPSAVLCRTNACAMETLLNFQARDVKAHLVGGGAEIVAFAKAAQDLMDGKRTYHPELACFESWEEVREYVVADPQGDDLRLLVRMVEEYGVAIIMDAVNGMMAEDAADVVVSTAHKAKGREWPTVRLGPDFPDVSQRENPEAELRLLYVAATRARDVLDVRACGTLTDMLKVGG